MAGTSSRWPALVSSAESSPGRCTPSATTTNRQPSIPATIQPLRSRATTVLLTTSTLTVLPSTATASAVIEGRLRTMRPVCQMTPKNARLTNTSRSATADVLRLGEAADDDLKLAAEHPGERQPAERQRGGHEHRAGPRHRAAGVGDPLDLLGVIAAQQRAGAEERQPLRRRVGDHVQQRAGDRERRAEPDPERDDAHVLDRGVGEQPLVVAPGAARRSSRRSARSRRTRSARARRTHGRRWRPRPGRTAGSRRTRPPAASLTASPRPAPALRCARPAARCASARTRPWCRNPTTESTNASRTASGERRVRVRDEACELRDVGAAERVGAGRVQHDDRQQRDPEAAGGDQHVLPRRLERGVGAVDRDQQRGDDRRQLDRDPQRPEVGGERDQQHHAAEQVQQRVVARERTRRTPGCCARRRGSRSRTPPPSRRAGRSRAGTRRRASRAAATRRRCPAPDRGRP